MSGVDTPAAALQAYEATPAPADPTPWREADLCVVDLETTGLDPDADEIIAFATLRIAGGRLRLRDARSGLVRPGRMPEAETIRIHGLRSEDLTGAPPLSEAMDELLEALTGTALVAHGAWVEAGFLGRALRHAGTELRNPIIDTVKLATALAARLRRPAPGNLGLGELARDLGLPVHRPHQADGDALTTAQVFLALATRIDALEPQTIGSLRDRGYGPGAWARLRRMLRPGR